MINYFNTQTSLNNFQFQFDPNRWVPTAEDINKGLKENKGLFKTDQASWDRYADLFEFDSSDIVQGDLDSLINYITQNHYSKIITPK